MTDLTKFTAIITGASTGLGAAIGKTLAKAGVKVVLAARRAAELKKVVAEITHDGGKATSLSTDVTDEKDVAALFAHAKSKFGSVDILINNAGMTILGATEDLSLESWNKVIGVNLTGAFLCSREALRLMKAQKSGRIISIGSISSRVPRQSTIAYTTTKFGLDGMTHSLALDGRDYGVSASVIHPGNIETPFWDGRKEYLAREGCMKPEDVANVVLTMVSLPPEVNLYHSFIIPVRQPLLGRG